MKHRPIFLVVAIVFVILLFTLAKPHCGKHALSIFGSSGQAPSDSRLAKSDSESGKSVNEARISESLSRIVANPLPAPPPDSQISTQRLKGGSGSDSDFGRIVIAGKSIFEGTANRLLTNYYFSPDGRFVLVNTYTSSKSKAFVLDVTGTKVFDLPPYPDGMIACEWVWLGNNRLIGYYGPNELDEFENLQWTRFWLYDIQSKEISELELPDEFKEKRLVIEVLKTGQFEMTYEAESRHQWFSLHEPNQSPPRPSPSEKSK